MNEAEQVFSRKMAELEQAWTSRLTETEVKVTSEKSRVEQQYASRCAELEAQLMASKVQVEQVRPRAHTVVQGRSGAPRARFDVHVGWRRNVGDCRASWLHMEQDCTARIYVKWLWFLAGFVGRLIVAAAWRSGCGWTRCELSRCDKLILCALSAWG